MGTDLLAGREKQIHRKGDAPFAIDCDKQSMAGAVSQRACVFWAAVTESG